MQRTALIAGLSILALSAGPAAIAAPLNNAEVWWHDFAAVEPADRSVVAARKPPRKRSKSTARADKRELDGIPSVPPGPLHVVVSIDQQRATLFADGKPVATSAISSGTKSHPTPLGVFTVIQKRRHHISNLYGAPMPYMQRLTWSGTALHEGPLPGYPASHGCIRLPKAFAQLLWKATRIGARVIVTAGGAAPKEFKHPSLFAPASPPMAQLKRAAELPPPARIKTADATGVAPGAVVRDAPAKPFVSEAAANALAAEQPTKALLGADGAIELSTPLPEAPVNGHGLGGAEIAAPPMPLPDPRPDTPLVATSPGKPATSPVSVFISRKQGKLYVRQKMEPLFETPITITDPDRPIGTHVYTAMGADPNGDGMRWTVVSIPSRHQSPIESGKNGKSAKSKRGKAVPPVAVEPAPVLSPGEALDRIVMPVDAAAQIAAMITPGSSLIVSDNRLSGETGEYTDFVVLTP